MALRQCWAPTCFSETLTVLKLTRVGKTAGLVTEPRPLYITTTPTYDLTQPSRKADREKVAHEHTKSDGKAKPGNQKGKTPD